MNVSSSRVSVLLAQLLFGSVLAAQATVEITEDRVPGQFYQPDWLCFRVVDDLTGAPIAGAEVFLLRESETPMAGEFRSLGSQKSAADGRVEMAVAKLGRVDLQVLRHPDYGVCSRQGGEWDTWRVGRAFDVPVLVRDWQGQPATGAFIGFCGGCGHTPDLANATTGPDGIATLRGIDPHNDIRDVYVQRAGLGLGYRSVEWYPGDPPSIVQCAWSYAMTGRVLDHLGEPVAGAFVAALDVHRGPWTRTRTDGTFTLLGADPDIGASHVRTRFGHGVWFATPDRAAYPITLRLPDPKGDDPHEGTVTGAGGAPAAVHPLPALRDHRVTFPAGVDPADLYTRVVVPGLDKNLPVEDGVAQVPETGPFVIFCSHSDDDSWWRNRAYAFRDVGELPAAPLALRPLPPTRVTGEVLDPAGRPAAARVRWLRSWRFDAEKGDKDYVDCPAGRIQLTSTASGKAMLEIAPADPGLRRRLVFVTLPLRGDDRLVDLGRLTLRAEPQLVIGDADGPLAGAAVRWARAGFQEAGSRREYELDGEGAWVGHDLLAGDVIEVLGSEADGDQPARFLLEGDGPWRFEVPAGRLTIAVTDADGEALAAAVTYADRCVDLPAGGAMRRLPLGPLELWVTCDGYGAAHITTEVTTQPQRIGIVLPRK